METTSCRLLELYNKIWETETWPKTWKQGLIVKTFKKGDLKDFHHWRGMTLLLFISKNLQPHDHIDRIKKGVDRKLWKEQAELDQEGELQSRYLS